MFPWSSSTTNLAGEDGSGLCLSFANDDLRPIVYRGDADQASLREGLEETLTVVRLGVSAVLRRTLATTNPIESALSVTRRVTARVTRWRDGDMRKRWCTAGLLRAEAKFH